MVGSNGYIGLCGPTGPTITRDACIVASCSEITFNSTSDLLENGGNDGVGK